MKKRDKKLIESMQPEPSSTDPQGSWTGLPVDGEYETPVQDADDL